MKKLLILLLFVFAALTARAQERDPAYVQTISERTDRNMSGLGITDPEATVRVKAAIVGHYYFLNDLEAQRDSLRTLARDPQSGVTAEEVAALVDARLYRHHFAFLSELMVDLNDEQVEGVKNALTYNVLHVTYDSYLDMIPTLTDVQKRRMYTWLWEARELAMDAGSSGEKHGVFGKYKGRINNYLSREGYDLTRERDAWNERIRQRQTE